VGLVLLAAGCGRKADPSTVMDGGADALVDGQADATPDAGPPTTIAEHRFGPFGQWSDPIDDYLAVGAQNFPGVFSADINELIVFEDRMWIGYGDANYNLGGLIPIEFRYFQTADDPVALSAIVDGEGQGAPQQTIYQSGEEQIDRYRICNGALWQAGIDSIDTDELWTQANTNPPAVQGNVYLWSGTTWVKHRSITGGEHVHDVAFWNGAIYAVGSGADNRIEFEAGEIHRYLWRSTDEGQTFETVQRIPHPVPGDGDSRFVHLLPVTEQLFAFGYESDFQSGTAFIANGTLDGTEVVPIPAGNLLSAVFPNSTTPLPDGTGLVYGVDVSQQPLRYAALHVAADGSSTRITSLTGMTVLDVFFHPATAEIVYLVREGDDYTTDPVTYDLHVLVAPLSDPGDTVDVLQYSVPAANYAIAFWDGGLFMGTHLGRLFKSVHEGS